MRPSAGTTKPQRKWESITTKEAQELAADGYKYSRDFFERLAESLAQR